MRSPYTLNQQCDNVGAMKFKIKVIDRDRRRYFGGRTIMLVSALVNLNALPLKYCNALTLTTSLYWPSSISPLYTPQTGWLPPFCKTGNWRSIPVHSLTTNPLRKVASTPKSKTREPNRYRGREPQFQRLTNRCFQMKLIEKSVESLKIERVRIHQTLEGHSVVWRIANSGTEHARSDVSNKESTVMNNRLNIRGKG